MSTATETPNDDVMDLPEDALSESTDDDPSFDNEPQDSAPEDTTPDSAPEDDGDDDDDLIEITDDAFVPVVNFANAIPAPVDTWLPFEIQMAVAKEPGDPYYDSENPQIIVSAAFLTNAFGGRQWPFRLYLDKKFKPRESNRKPNPNAKPPVSTLQRLVVGTGLATQGGQKVSWSTLPEQLEYQVFMGQLYHAPAREKEFSLPAVYGEYCALVSPVNGHHFSDLPYTVVTKVEDEMLDDPEYAIHSDDDGNTTVLRPVYDEAGLEKAVNKAVEKLNNELDSSSLDDDQKAAAIDTEARLARARFLKLTYYNPARNEATVAGAVFKNEHGDEMEHTQGGKATFGSDDPIFDSETGYGQKPGTEILTFNGSEYTHLAKVPAPKDSSSQDPKDLIRSERLSPRTIAPVPNRMLSVKEEGKDATPHYQVQWHHVGLLAIGDTPVTPGTVVDTLDVDSESGELVQLRYGADSAWHLATNEA
jgi:hypothetical protein